MRWITDLPDTTPMRFSVSIIMEFAVMTIGVEGNNDWSDEYVLHVANQLVKDEYSFSPLDYIHADTIEAEVI